MTSKTLKWRRDIINILLFRSFSFTKEAGRKSGGEKSNKLDFYKEDLLWKSEQ